MPQSIQEGIIKFFMFSICISSMHANLISAYIYYLPAIYRQAIFLISKDNIPGCININMKTSPFMM